MNLAKASSLLRCRGRRGPHSACASQDSTQRSTSIRLGARLRPRVFRWVRSSETPSAGLGPLAWLAPAAQSGSAANTAAVASSAHSRRAPAHPFGRPCVQALSGPPHLVVNPLPLATLTVVINPVDARRSCTRECDVDSAVSSPASLIIPSLKTLESIAVGTNARSDRAGLRRYTHHSNANACVCTRPDIGFVKTTHATPKPWLQPTAAAPTASGGQT